MLTTIDDLDSIIAGHYEGRPHLKSMLFSLFDDRAQTSDITSASSATPPPSVSTASSSLYPISYTRIYYNLLGSHPSPIRSLLFHTPSFRSTGHQSRRQPQCSLSICITNHPFPIYSLSFHTPILSWDHPSVALSEQSHFSMPVPVDSSWSRSVSCRT